MPNETSKFVEYLDEKTLRTLNNFVIYGQKTIGPEASIAIIYALRENDSIKFLRENEKNGFKPITTIIQENKEIFGDNYQDVLTKSVGTSMKVNDSSSFRAFWILNLLNSKLYQNQYITSQAVNAILDMKSAGYFLNLLEYFDAVESMTIRVDRTAIIPANPSRASGDITLENTKISSEELNEVRDIVKNYSDKRVKAFRIRNPDNFPEYQTVRGLLKSSKGVYLSDLDLYLRLRSNQLNHIGILSQDPVRKIKTGRIPEFCFHVPASKVRRVNSSHLAERIKGIFSQVYLLGDSGREGFVCPFGHDMHLLYNRFLIGLYSDSKDKESFAYYIASPSVLNPINSRDEEGRIVKVQAKLPDVSTRKRRGNIKIARIDQYSDSICPVTVAKEVVGEGGKRFANVFARPVSVPYIEDDKILTLEMLLSQT